MVRVRLGLLVSPALVAVLTLAGCGQQPEADDSTPPEASATQATDAPGTPGGGRQPPAVPAVLDFDAAQVSGAPFDPRSLAGTDTVFWFWAPWCTECAAAAAGVQDAADANDNVTFVGVAGLSSDAADMQGFVDEHGLTFTQLADLDGGVYTHFGITQQDTYVLVSADGDVETIDGYGSDVDAQQLVDDAFG